MKEKVWRDAEHCGAHGREADGRISEWFCVVKKRG